MHSPYSITNAYGIHFNKLFFRQTVMWTDWTRWIGSKIVRFSERLSKLYQRVVLFTMKDNVQSVTISHWKCFTWVDLRFTIKWLYFDLLYIHNQLILRCLLQNNVLTVLECDDELVYCPFLRILSRGYML